MVAAANLLSFFGLLALTIASAVVSRRSEGCEEHPTGVEPRAAPPPPMTMAYGTSRVFGKVGNLTWDATGILTKGCTAPGSISNCYGMYLSPNASQMLDTDHLDSPRQRNEWHFPTVTSGKMFSYSWKQYLDPACGSSTHFFHLMQVFGVPENNPIVTLDALSNALKIVDFVSSTCGGGVCPSTPLSNYLGKYTVHSISGVCGPKGKLTYTVTNGSPAGSKIISYSRSTGGLGSGDCYVKFGTYRMAFTPMTAVNAMVGDFVPN